MPISDCHIIELPRITDPRGSLSFFEGKRHVPFDIARIYYIYDVPAGFGRGAHAHRRLQQLFLALSGSFDVILDDGTRRVCHTLDSPHRGLYVAPMMWRELENFSAGAVCLVAASLPYDEADYIRDYAHFLQEVNRP